MEPEIVMPAPLIKEEDISEDVVIDLDNYRSIEDVTEEWEIKIFENFKCFFIADNHNLAKLMKWYIKSLKEEAVDILNDDALKSYILRHINFFKLHFVEVGGCFADSYLDSLEEILSIYCNLEVKLLPKKLGNSKNYLKRYKRRISLIIHQLVVLAKHCLLDREERLLHVFMKMNVVKDSEEAKTFFNLLFSKFLAIDPKDKSNLAFCRAYILCQKWKKITDEEEWPKMDKMVYTAFQKTAVSINSNETLRSILLPQNDSVLDLITHKSNDPSVLCEAYFKYIRSETFHELDDLTNLEISESDDEDFLPFDTHDELDDGAFIKAYRTYVKSMKPVCTFYNNQSKQNDQDEPVEEIFNPEDSECCIVSVGTRDVNPSDTQIVHEIPDDDDISEIIYFIKKDPPSTRKKKNLNKSFDSTLSTSASTSTGLTHSPVRIKERPVCSRLKQGVTIETQTEVDFNRVSRQGGQEDIHKRFYDILTPPSDQNIEENISELSVYTNIVSSNIKELLTPQDKSVEAAVTINDEVIFLSDSAKAIKDSQVANNSVSPKTSDSVEMLSSNTPPSMSNPIVSRHFLPTSRDTTEVQGYTQQSKSYVPSSLSTKTSRDGLTKNINVFDTGSDKILEKDGINVKSDDRFIQKDVPPTEKQADLNVFLNSVDILSDAHRSPDSLTSTSTFTEYAKHTTTVNQDNVFHENEIMEPADIPSSMCPTLTKRVTIETQTESDFNCISQQGRKEDINKAFYGILTPPSDQNIEENVTNLSVYTKIVNPKSTNQKVSQNHSKDISTAENKCNSIKIIQNCPIEDNLITPHVSIASAGLFSLDASNLITCSDTRPLLQTSNKIISDVTNNLQQIEPYTTSALDNTKNENEDHHVDDMSRESSVNSTELDKSFKPGELPPPTEKQKEANILLDSDVLSDSPTLSSTVHSSSTMIVEKHNNLQEIVEHSDFNHLNQQQIQENLNQRIFGSFTPPSDQNVDENLTDLIETNSINQKDDSKDNSSAESAITSEDSCVEMNPSCPREDNLITSNTSLPSAQLFSIDTAPNVICRESRQLLHSSKNISDIINSVQQFETCTVTLLDNAENQNEEVGKYVSDIIEDSSVKNNKRNEKCKAAEEIANENFQRNDELFEKPKPPKVKELKVAIQNMGLVVTNVKEKININAEKKIMFTSPLKVTRAGLADFSYFEDTLHKKWQQIRETNTLDDFLCGPVEKINGAKNCLSLEKAFDIFENTDFRITTPNVTPNTTPTTSSTELTSPAYEEGLDDFRNFYDEKKNGEHCVSPSPSPSPDRPQNRKRSTQYSEEINSNEQAVIGHSVSIPVKRKRIAIDETIREHYPSAIESTHINLNPKNPPKGILKKFSSTYLEAKRNTAHILIPRSKICLASLDHYGVSPTDHQLQSKVCVVLEKISKHEITQWLRVSEISRKVRMEKEGYKWYAFECLDFKKNDTSKSKNGISQTNMPGPSTSGTITQWRTPTGLFPSSFSNKNTVGLPAVNHQLTSQASKGMVDTTLTNDNNDNFNNLSSICDGACCQHIAEAFSKLQISIPKVHSASTSTIRNPFLSTESGTDERNIDSQENCVVIKFVPVSNIPKTTQPTNSPISQPANIPIPQYANIPLPQPGNEPILRPPDVPKSQMSDDRISKIADILRPQLNDIAMPQPHNIPERQLHDVPKPHSTDISTIQPILKPIPKPIVVPIPQPTVVPELSEFEKILNMKTLTIPLDLQNLDLRRLSPSPVINSMSPQQVSPNSTFTTDCLLNEELDSQGNAENFPINSQILHSEFINSINVVKQSLQSDSAIQKLLNRDSDMSHQDEHSYTIFVDTPLTTVCDKSLQDSLSKDPNACMQIKRVCEENLQDSQSCITVVDIPSNTIVEKLRHDEKNNNMLMDKPSNRVSDKYLHSCNKTMDIPLKRSCEIPVQDEQNLNGSVEILLSKVWGEYHVQDDQSSNTTVDIPANSITEKHVQDKQNENMALYKSFDRFSDKCVESDHSYNRAANKPSNRVCEVIPQDVQNYNTTVDKSLNGVSDKHFHIDQSGNVALEIIPNKVCEKPHQVEQDCNTAVDIPIIGDPEKHQQCKPTSDPTLVISLNQVCDKSIKGKPVEILLNKLCKMSQNQNISMALPLKRISEKPIQSEQRYETVDIPLNIVYERHLQLEDPYISDVEKGHTTVSENPPQCEQSNNTVMEISSDKINEKNLDGQQDCTRVVDRSLRRVCENSLQSEQTSSSTIKIASNRTCQKPLHVNTAVDVQLKSIPDETLQDEQSYNLPVVEPLNEVSDKSSESKGNYNNVDIPLNRVPEIPLPEAQDLNRFFDMSLNRVREKRLKDKQNYDLVVGTSLNRVTGNNLQREHNYNKEIPSNRVNEVQQCDNRASGISLNRVCEEPLEVEQTYNTSVYLHHNRTSELSCQDKNNVNRNDDILNRGYELTYNKTVELSNKLCRQPLQNEQVHSSDVDTSYIRVSNKHLQSEQVYDTTVHIPLNRIGDIPLQVKQNHKTAADISLNRDSMQLLQSKQSYKTIDDSQSKIVEDKSIFQHEQNYYTALKLLSSSNCNNSLIDEKIYNSATNLSLEKDFDLTDTTIKTDCKFMEIDEIETHLPLKKRKHSVANCTDEDSDDDFLGPDLVEEIIKRARSEELQKDDISYPAKPMISIAEVQEKLTEHQQPRVFRTPAEKKEMPPPPPPPQASQVNFLETPKIITEQYNNHTYNNPTINYHMNNVPYTIFSCGSIPYFPPIIVPMSSTTTFDMNMMPTPQEQQQQPQPQQQQPQPQTTTASNRVHQSSSTQGATTRSRRNRKTTEDRGKTDGH